MTEEANTCIEILRKAAQFGLIDCRCCPAYPMCPTGTVGWNNECMFDTAADLIASLSEQLEQVTRERDAAIKDLKLIISGDLSCAICGHYAYDEDDESRICADCDVDTYSNWHWRGVEVE